MIADNKNLESTILKLEKELLFIKKQDPNCKYCSMGTIKFKIVYIYTHSYSSSNYSKNKF